LTPMEVGAGYCRGQTTNRGSDGQTKYHYGDHYLYQREAGVIRLPAYRHVTFT
jgi:hypothetical protein